MIPAETQETRSAESHYAAIDHLVDVIPQDRPLTISIDGLPAFEIHNQTARRRLAAALERAIETEITQISIEEAEAGNTIPLEQVQAELEQDDLLD